MFTNFIYAKMKAHIYYKAFFLILTIIILPSCSKEEGFGGKASIKGKLITQAYNKDQSVLQSTFPATDEEVFIVFGDSQNIGESVNTSFDGSFSFNYLTPGDYTLFYYSEKTLQGEPGEEAVKHQVTIKKSDKTIDLGELERVELLDFDEGKASISGKIMEIDISGGTYDTSNAEPAMDEEVYLVYGERSGFDERIRTSYDGSFSFPNLLKGNYTVFVYSDSPGGGNTPVRVLDSITEENQHVQLQNIYISKN